MKKLVAIVVCLMVTFIAHVHADIVFSSADANTAMTVVNGGSEAVTIGIVSAGASSNNLVIIGSTTNTINGAGDIDTVAEFAAAIEACVNSDGDAPLSVKTGMSLSTDSTDGELLTGSYTLAAGIGQSVNIPLDTSAALYYSIYVPKGELALVYGDPKGTGALTLSVYENGSLVFNQVASTNDNLVIEEDFGTIGLPTSGKVIVRATRATSATTGNLGAVTK